MSTNKHPIIKRLREQVGRQATRPPRVNRPAPKTTTQPPLPSLTKRAANFAKAAVTHGLAGAPTTDTSEQERRIGLCRKNMCGQFRSSDNACAACGCQMKKKIAWAEQKCPLGIWEMPDMSSIDNGEWAVGITTAPRKDPQLGPCVASLLANNWTPIIFAEPKSDLSGAMGCPVVQRNVKRGAWHNWLDMVQQLLHMFPSATKFLTVQDDTVIVPNSRQFLEEEGWPDQQTAFVSLYLPRHYSYRYHVYRPDGKLLQNFPNKEQAALFAKRHGYTMRQIKKAPGVLRITSKSLWGACAMAFPRDFLQLLVGHQIAKSWRGAGKKPHKDPSKVANVDTVIGHIANALKKKMFFVNPSCSQHVAVHSSIPNHGTNTGNRAASELANNPLIDCRPLHRVITLSNNDLTQAATALAAKLPRDIVAIVGVPRAGILPASLIATQLNIPCLMPEQVSPEIGPVLLVDDIAWTGHTLQEVKDTLPAGTRTAAVYCTERAKSLVDFHQKHISAPDENVVIHEWGWHSGPNINRIMLEVDRLLCPAAPVNEFRNPEQYKQFLQDALPILRTRGQLAGICTERYEAHKETTVRWLEQHGIEYNLLAMHPGFARKQDIRNQVQVKAQTFDALDEAAVFLEPNHQIAMQIRAIVTKPVLCMHCWTLMPAAS